MKVAITVKFEFDTEDYNLDRRLETAGGVNSLVQAMFRGSADWPWEPATGELPKIEVEVL